MSAPLLPKPLFRDPKVAIAAGALMFLAGSFCLYDAWERRGGSTPRIFRPLTWW